MGEYGTYSPNGAMSRIAHAMRVRARLAAGRVWRASAGPWFGAASSFPFDLSLRGLLSNIGRANVEEAPDRRDGPALARRPAALIPSLDALSLDEAPDRARGGVLSFGEGGAC